MTNLSTRSRIFRITALIIIDAFALNLVYGIALLFSPILGLAIFVGMVIINFVYLFDRFYVWRWTAPGLALLGLTVLFPLVNTIYIAFTNYGDGHLENKPVVLAQLDRAYFTPPDAVSYKAYFLATTPKPTATDQVIVWLVDPDGKAYVGSVSEGLKPEATAPATFGTFGEKNANGVPTTIGEYTLLTTVQVLPNIQFLTNEIKIQDGQYLIRVTGISTASQQVKQFVYDENTGKLLDRETGLVYTEIRGAFYTTNEQGELVRLPGYGGWPVFIGLENFTRAITSENVRGPFGDVFMWTLVMAILSVFSTFALGLLFALTLNGPGIPGRGIFRTLLVIPYALPAFISILVWKGLLQPSGFITEIFKNVFGVAPNWFNDPWLAKLAILGTNLWLGFPYMMLITMGALQSIPGDLYEAAVIDGANVLNQFRRITLPLLLVAVGPLLIGSFAFNFNNFALIELMTKGGPAANAASVAGQTDILISYSYRLAFGATKGADYGFASAISIFIFLIVAAVTTYNFRLTRNLEKVYSND